MMSHGQCIDCVVMVTGGSGFLGQHVIKLLNIHADHVTSIRVVDLVPVTNKLDYTPTKPIHQYTGSVTDSAFMKKALIGCHTVIHLAAFADPSMFPNNDRIEDVNNKGTTVTLTAALDTPECSRFIGCGSMSAYIDTRRSVTNGNEGTLTPNTFLFGAYASSKRYCEEAVLAFNCARLRTVYIHPVLMYGELDDTYMPVVFESVMAAGGTMYPVSSSSIHQHAYVGNVAWAFVTAEKRLYEEGEMSNTDVGTVVDRVTDLSEGFAEVADGVPRIIKACQKDLADIDPFENGRQLRNRSGVGKIKTNPDIDTVRDCSGDLQAVPESISGHVFFIADDTPHQHACMFQEQFVKASGYQVSSLKIPHFLILCLIHAVYFALLVLSYMGVKKNLPISIPAIQYLNRTELFSCQKAVNRMSYVPLYSSEEALQKSISYYKNIYGTE